MVDQILPATAYIAVEFESDIEALKFFETVCEQKPSIYLDVANEKTIVVPRDMYTQVQDYLPEDAVSLLPMQARETSGRTARTTEETLVQHRALLQALADELGE